MLGNRAEQVYNLYHSYSLQMEPFNIEGFASFNGSGLFPVAFYAVS